MSWEKEFTAADCLAGVEVVAGEAGEHSVHLAAATETTAGKYTVTAVNSAGRATKSILVQLVENQEVYNAYQKFTKYIIKLFIYL